MIKRFRPFQSFRIIAAMACGLSFAAIAPLRAITIETYDDKSTTGTIAGIDGNQLLLKPKASDPAVTKIPLLDIVGINLTWQDRQAFIAPPSTQPAASTTHPAAKTTKWRVEIGPNDHVIASLNDWADTGITLALDNNATMKIPVDQVHAVWSSVAFQVKKAKDLKISPQAQDVAFVEKDGEVKAVSGLAVGIESEEGGDFLKFKFEGEERKIKLDRLVGVMLAQREVAPEKSQYATFNLVNGDVLSGKIRGYHDGLFELVPLAVGDSAAPVDISLGVTSKVEFHNGRLAWLTDLVPSSVSQAPYFDTLMPYQVNQSLTGGPLVMAEGTVVKGIAVHARCVLTYDLDTAYETFRGKVGFQQPDGKFGRAACRIVGDGKVLWQDQDLRGDAKSTPLSVSIAGIKQLTLEVDYGKNQDVADRVIWAEPRLIKAAAAN